MNTAHNLNFYLATAFILLIVGCQSKTNKPSQADAKNTRSSQVSSEKELANQKQSKEWTVLFDGKNTDHWRKVYEKSFPSSGWKVHDGVLTVLHSNGRQGGEAGSGGSIVTKKEYSDFELQLDFKLTKAANSGIKYFVVENPDFFDGDPGGAGIGLEYQILDDKNHPDAKKGVNGNRTVASLYDMIPANKDKKVKPLGQWNHAKIISDGNHVEHWLNGQKVLEYERGSDAFDALVDKSKYGYENFGLEPKGHILLQDHGTRVSFKDIKIKEL